MIEDLKSIINEKIINSNDTYKFNCIYCSDSTKSAVLYKNDNSYHCFKCGVHKNPIQLIEDFNLKILDNQYNDYLVSINKNNLFRIGNKTAYVIEEFAIDKDTLMLALSAKAIKYDSRAKRFIKNKNLSKYERFFAVDPYNAKIFLFNLTKLGNVLSYWAIDLRDFGKIKAFKDLKTLHTLIKSKKVVPESYNKLSEMLNITNIDISKPVIIFDDVINSLFIPNGIFTNNNYHIFDSLSRYYMFAYNSHGKRLYEEKKKIGEKVFNWESFFNDNLDLKRRKIYDLHDLKILENKINKEYEISKYFN